MDINATINLLQVFRELFPNVTVNQVLTFLIVARNGTASQQQIAQELSISEAAASRNVDHWVDHPFFKVANKGFVTRIEDYGDRRYKLVKLNEHGVRLAEHIRKV